MALKFNPITGQFDLVGTSTNPPIGDASRIVVEGVAGENLSGDRVVYRDEDGMFYYASCLVPNHAARPMRLTTGAVMSGDTGEFIAVGEHTEGSWSWSPGMLLFLNTDGFMTHTPPDAPCFVLQVANVIDSQSIYFDPKIPFVLN